MTTRLTPDEGPMTKTRATATLTRIPMKTLPPLLRKKFKAIKDLLVYSVPMRTRFRRVTSRDGILLHGKAGWGEAAPFWDYGPEESARWIDAAINEATVPIPFTRRKSVPVNVTVPVLSPEAAAARVEESHGCATAKVKVADPGSSLKEDCARVEAVADALTRTVKRERWIRLDANGAWDVDQAVTAIHELERAAGDVPIEYVEQPCATADELYELHRLIDVPIAADESVHLSADPLAVRRLEAADVVVLKAAPLGGVRRALVLAEKLDLPAVVCSALDTSVGVGAGLRLAAALPVLEYACGLGTVGLLSSDVAIPSVLPVRGFLPLRPVHVSETMLAAAGADDDLTARWATRLEHILAALTERREREAADRLSPVAGLPL